LSQLEYRTVAVESQNWSASLSKSWQHWSAFAHNVTQREKLLNILDSSALWYYRYGAF
jgi:hypothetical protein